MNRNPPNPFGGASNRSRTGGFWENKPSQYRPPSTGTERNRVGIAAEASTASAVISPRPLSKDLYTPDSTSTAPTTNNGHSGAAESAPNRLKRSKSTHRSSNDRS